MSRHSQVPARRFVSLIINFMKIHSHFYLSAISENSRKDRDFALSVWQSHESLEDDDVFKFVIRFLQAKLSPYENKIFEIPSIKWWVITINEQTSDANPLWLIILLIEFRTFCFQSVITLFVGIALWFWKHPRLQEIREITKQKERSFYLF